MNLNNLKSLSKALGVQHDMRQGAWRIYKDNEEAQKQMILDSILYKHYGELLERAETTLFLKSLVDAEISRQKEHIEEDCNERQRQA